VRIVCFGASETFGLYEAPDEEYPRQLERDLNQLAGRPEFQVVNAAFPGETLRTAILRVPQVVSQIHPSYALIYPTLANYIDLAPPQEHAARPSNSPSLSDFVSDMRITERAHNLLKSSLPDVIQTKLRDLEIKRDTAHITVMKTLPEKNVDRFREDLTTLVDALKAHGVEPVLVTHATAFGLSLTPRDRDLLAAWRKFYPMLEESGFMDVERRLNQMVREIAVCKNLALIDAANEIPPGPENFADMVHFTTKGAGVMAGDLAAGLKPVLFSQAGSKALTTSTDQSRNTASCASSRGFAANHH
ncbi:MAG: SGNH/GDSL hydrolase family protein, partial [Candidatus Acidiferrales bacterium]